ncbi:MAG: type I methionyl aminopeptidase [SAR324 cluster bacterium]|nr:type I methionyl aminopeptidase [SAR324 cluster bacterium]
MFLKNNLGKGDIGRNDPCFCGSGKKYKKCCLIKMEKGQINQPSRVINRSRSFILGMVNACRLTRRTLEFLTPYVKVGVSTEKLNQLAHDFMVKHKAYPATLGYQGYPKSICTSVNEVICHGIPSERELVNGDIINIDVSCQLDGYYGDASVNLGVGEISANAKKLIEVTKECLNLGIKAVKGNSFIGNIGYAIENHAHKHGFSVVEEFVGHGIGRNFHEDPQVPHFGRQGGGVEILPGMIFTIEPMINQGNKELRILKDGWTAITADKKLSAQVEHTILVTNDGVRILTDEADDDPIF